MISSISAGQIVRAGKPLFYGRPLSIFLESRYESALQQTLRLTHNRNLAITAKRRMTEWHARCEPLEILSSRPCISSSPDIDYNRLDRGVPRTLYTAWLTAQGAAELFWCCPDEVGFVGLSGNARLFGDADGITLQWSVPLGCEHLLARELARALAALKSVIQHQAEQVQRYNRAVRKAVAERFVSEQSLTANMNQLKTIAY